MRNKLKEIPGEPVAKNECRHYRIIEGAKGAASRGVCQFCGAEKEFHNSWPDATYAERDSRVFELTEPLSGAS